MASVIKVVFGDGPKHKEYAFGANNMDVKARDYAWVNALVGAALAGKRRWDNQSLFL